MKRPLEHYLRVQENWIKLRKAELLSGVLCDKDNYCPSLSANISEFMSEMSDEQLLGIKRHVSEYSQSQNELHLTNLGRTFINQLNEYWDNAAELRARCDAPTLAEIIGDDDSD